MENISLTPNFKLIGHRGVAGLRPENTLCSFEFAAELGLNWIEFDVQLSKDKKWVVIHDETVDRTTNRTGKVTDFSQAELGLLEAGLWFKPPYPKQMVPSLETTLALAKSLNLNCNIEIKGSLANPKLYATLMAEFLNAHDNLPPNLLFSSFELPFLIQLRQLLPAAAIAMLVDNFTADTIYTAQENNFASINCDVNTITLENLRAASQNNIPVMLFTINDPLIAKYWFAKGISAIFTDRPDLLKSEG